MKKLMIVAAVALAAVSVNAASVVWSTAAITVPDGTKGNITKSKVNAYLFCNMGAAIDGDIWAALTTKTGTGADTVWTINSGYGPNVEGGTQNGIVVSTATLTATDNTSYSVGQTAYDAIVMVRDVNGDGHIGVGDYYMVDQGSKAIAADTRYDVSFTNMQTANWVQLTAGGPDPVPEPTSGLLLLLGVAGLALRRKQK